MTKPKLTIPTLSQRDVEGFWKRVQIGDPAVCWPWTGTISAQGYGVISYRRGGGQAEKHQYRAHRIAYFLHYGVDPGPLFACHACDNRPCCNPHHLFLGTTDDNMADMCRKGRQAKGARLKRYDQIARGERQGNAILTTEKVLAMRLLYDWNLATIREIARGFGVRYPHAWHIVTRKSWRHLP